MSQPYAIVDSSDPAHASTAKVVYILYLVGLVVGITPIVGVIIAYVNRSSAPFWVQTHYQVQIRTFWIGMLYGLVAAATTFVMIGFAVALFSLVWWIVRCAKGLKTASAGLPYDNPTSWLW
ncbi:MAG: hypothetical protein JO001_13405 [Alphaproteobacteria bacterium]|nr:hypothetical protein [Alphaproteobacteria bacterium]